MPTWLADLLFWIVALTVMFFGFRYLQSKKNKDKDDKD